MSTWVDVKHSVDVAHPRRWHQFDKDFSPLPPNWIVCLFLPPDFLLLDVASFLSLVHVHGMERFIFTHYYLLTRLAVVAFCYVTILDRGSSSWSLRKCCSYIQVAEGYLCPGSVWVLSETRVMYTCIYTMYLYTARLYNHNINTPGLGDDGQPNTIEMRRRSLLLAIPAINHSCTALPGHRCCRIVARSFIHIITFKQQLKCNLFRLSHCGITFNSADWANCLLFVPGPWSSCSNSETVADCVGVSVLKDDILSICCK